MGGARRRAVGGSPRPCRAAAGVRPGAHGRILVNELAMRPHNSGHW
ncbi:ATP-grasp domain-containing protein, partial [Streptomyces cyaneofuscatus]